MLGINRQGSRPQGDFLIPSGSVCLKSGSGQMSSGKKVRVTTELLVWDRKCGSGEAS